MGKTGLNQKVLLAMSGGVDSSVAALLLKQQGYEVTGAFMKNWSNTKNPLTGECSWREERRMAIRICALLKIPLITLDFEKQYKKDVVEEMFKDYKKGITPNPDVICNQKVKFPLLWKEAKKLGIKIIATGHYSRIKKTKQGFQLLRAKDEMKDQSYFLYKLNQNDLSHTLFPIGELTKNQTREIAKKNHFPNHDKKSTTGICFIGKINLKKFLEQKIPNKPGKILDPNGNKIGTHDGIYYYTVGQRLGPRFGIEVEKSKFDDKKQLKKWYVAKKDLKTNTIIAAPENHNLLYKKDLIIKDLYLINKKQKLPKLLHARIRHVGELLPSTIKKEKNKLKLILKKPITGISEGQAVVLYQGRTVLGGGVIGS